MLAAQLPFAVPRQYVACRSAVGSVLCELCAVSAAIPGFQNAVYVMAPSCTSPMRSSALRLMPATACTLIGQEMLLSEPMSPETSRPSIHSASPIPGCLAITPPHLVDH